MPQLPAPGPHNLIRRATLRTTADAIIIGAGVIGSAVGLELCRRGWRTLNLDKAPAAGYGSTSSSSAVVRAHYSTRDGVAMAHEGFSYWRQWRDYLGISSKRDCARFVNTGTILLKSSDALWHKALRHYRDLGVEHEDWDAATLAGHVPYYDLHRFGPPCRPDDPRFFAEPDPQDLLPGAIYTPGSGYVNDPQLAAKDLQTAAEAEGGEFLFRHEVVEVLRAAVVRGVRLDDGTCVEAPVVVNAAGPHSHLLNALAGVASGMKRRTRPMRHEVHVVPSPPGVDFEGKGVHTSDGDLGIYFRPEVGNSIMVGSEDPPCDPREWVEDPEHFARTPTRSQFETNVLRLAKRIPDLRVPRDPVGLADLYDVSDDWIPIYDRSDLPGFYMAIGTSGNQFKNAPVVGHLMAQLIVACEEGLDHDAAPLRIRGLFSGHEIDVGFFSRLREPAAESSFSVNG